MLNRWFTAPSSVDAGLRQPLAGYHIGLMSESRRPRRAIPIGLVVVIVIGLGGCSSRGCRPPEPTDGGRQADSGPPDAEGAAAAAIVTSCMAFCLRYPNSCPTCDSLSPVISSCIARCNLEVRCNADQRVEKCISNSCFDPLGTGVSLDQMPPACQDTLTTYFRCLLTQAVVCDPNVPTVNQPGACGAEADALAALGCF